MLLPDFYNDPAIGVLNRLASEPDQGQAEYMSTEQKRIAVIRAGIGGLTAGIYAAKNGFDVDLYEQQGVAEAANARDGTGKAFISTTASTG